MKNTLLTAGFLLLAAGVAQAQDTPKTPAAAPAPVTTAKHVPGNDRPDPATQRDVDGNRPVVYWNDTFDDMDLTIQSAANANSVEDLVYRSGKVW